MMVLKKEEFVGPMGRHLRPENEIPHSGRETQNTLLLPLPIGKSFSLS